MKRLWKVLIAAIIATGLMGFPGLCAAEKQPEAATRVAKVNDAAIYKKEFDVAYTNFESRLKGQGKQLSPSERLDVKKKVLETLIDTEVIYQASKKSNLTIDEEKLNAQWAKIKNHMETDEKYKANIEKMNFSESELKDQIRRQMSIQNFIADKFIKPAAVSEGEVKAYYDNNPEAFHRPEQVQASHILIKVESGTEDTQQTAALKKIQDIQQKVKSGDDFSALAQKHSQCPSNKKGGDLGYFGRGQMVKPFEEAAFSMEVGQVSDIVQTSFGYHLIKVTGKMAASTMSLEDADKKIENFLKQQKIQQAISQFVTAEKEKSTVERFLE